ncbi:PREDICTED: vesicle transport protein GOT1B-like [Amphimedon queenslandica]|uniref:Vesicle transport protein n=1 Tax=Amphimedon queenslandica TaxID=400682 RepID=A0A1X7V589_AMPQE|nr:PREDICTED: vesicle transport protein GOT1B-like [Amphimedon queenslandica]|eukprot:XP_003385614.1 PREDICTED: vesicle transport protein GOT1B-like [Amphimedon queenslandica]
MISVDLTDFQKIGLGLVAFGLGLLFLGVILFFDSGLLAIGNILFIAGILFIIGPQKTATFFFQSHKLKGTAFFAVGIFIVLCGWALIGMIVETYGAFLLFRGIIPYAIMFLRRLPVIGHALNLPGIRSVFDALSNDSASPA